MAKDVVLGFDVGATNTRAAVGIITAQGVERHPRFSENLTTEASSTKALYDFIVSILRVLEDEDSIEAATLAVAGPIEAGRQARMTNWQGTQPIDVGDLVGLGLPEGRVSLVNDLFAGAKGLTAWLERGPVGGLATVHSGLAPEQGNLVFVAPGTGLGAAGIVRQVDGTYLPVGCEAQHTLLPAFDDDAARLIATLSSGPGGGPTWEEVASGVGLAKTYEAYCSILGCGRRITEDDGGAKFVAESALAGSDPAAVAALDFYYRVIGRFAQMLALAFLPCAGVYIGGASTIRNRDFIGRSELVAHFIDNRVQGRLLENIPVHLVLEEVNLDGALAIASGMARAKAGVGG